MSELGTESKAAIGLIACVLAFVVAYLACKYFPPLTRMFGGDSAIHAYDLEYDEETGNYRTNGESAGLTQAAAAAPATAQPRSCNCCSCWEQLQEYKR